LSEEEETFLKRKRYELAFRKGEMLCKQGMPANSIICIKSGLLKIYRENDTHYNTISLKTKGDIIGLQSLFMEGNHLYSAEALSEVQACFFEVHTFESLLLRNSAFAREIVMYINNDMVNMFNKLYSYTTKHIHGRLAEFLIYLSERIYISNPFVLTMSKTDLSKILGTSKESISRIFRELKKDGIISECGKKVQINDPDRLRLISQTG
jgi:CRP/FNR family transcriptional regulator